MEDNIDVESYVRNILKLDVKDTSYDEMIGLCPEPSHSDRNPSWYINKNTGLHQCKSCNYRGNLRSLSHLILGYSRSMTILNKLTGVDGDNDDVILRNKIKKLTTETIIEEENEFDESSYNYYVNNFNKEILLSESIASKIKIYLTTPLLKKYNIKHWTIPGNYYNRITIPITDISGNILNINFRKISETDPIKYKCLPGKSSKTKLSDTVFFSSNCLEFLKNNVGKKVQYLVITEGCFDTIFLGESGIYSVSIFSNILSNSQIKIIQSLTNYPILFLDTDKQGISGQLKSIENVKNYINFYQINNLCNNKDPDEIETSLIIKQINSILDENS